MNPLHWVDKGLLRTENILSNAAAIVLLLSGLLGLEEIVLRYFFGASHGWGDMFVLTGSAYAGMVVLGAVQREGRQITLDVLYVRYKGKVKETIDIINSLATFVVGGIFTVFIAGFVDWEFRMGTKVEAPVAIPDWVSTTSFLVGMLLCSLVALQVGLHLMRKSIGGHRE